MTRGLLALIGILYIGLGLWCALQPATTSATVGFVLQPGAGQSEFLTVYGGLEVGLGIAFLLPLIQPAWERSTLVQCLCLHGAIVAFRTVGFVLFPNLPRATLQLATGEWVILLLCLWRFLAEKSRPSVQST